MSKELSPEALELRRKYDREYKRKWRQIPGNREREKEYRRRTWERKAKQAQQI
jgi:hypothetical protein